MPHKPPTNAEPVAALPVKRPGSRAYSTPGPHIREVTTLGAAFGRCNGPNNKLITKGSGSNKDYDYRVE